jgi:hypothetical protein
LTNGRTFPGEIAFLAVVSALLTLVVSVPALRGRWHAWMLIYLVGTPFILYGLAVIRRLRVVRRWPEFSARIVSAEVESVPVSDETQPLYFRPTVLFEYEVEGRRYRSSRFCPTEYGYLSKAMTDAPAHVRDLSKAGVATAKVSAANPSWAVLRTDLLRYRMSHVWAILTAGALICAVGIFIGIASEP